MTDPRPRILVVEDSKTQAFKMSAILEQEGWEPVWAPTSEKALEELTRLAPNLILLDYFLPGMRGDELCRRIKMNINTRNIPILMLTAEESGAAELHGLESGADDYISKSADEEILLIRVRNLLRKSRTHPAIPGTAESPFRKAKILAIDDSRTYLEYLAAELEGEGFAVEKAGGGRDGLERFVKDSFDCVIVDLMMPDVDGIEVCRQLSEIRRTMTNPFVMLMLTAHESKEDLTRALDAGADDFVGKSNDLAVLKGRIRALLRRKFYQDENRRILEELRGKELEAIRSKSEKDAAEQADRAKSGFLANMSHEIRTPMNAVIGMTDLLLDTPLSPEQEDYARTVKGSAESLLHLINDILDFSKIEAGKLELDELEFDPRELVGATLKTLSVRARSKNIDLRSRVAPEIPPRLAGDPSRLRQIVTNLVGNAVKFTGRGEVFLDAGIDTESEREIVLRFEVRDTGVGIPPDKQKVIFDAFTQIHAPGRGYEGTGLGLAICTRLVGLMGGSLGVESEPGRGSTFRFTARFKKSTAAAPESSMPVDLSAPAALGPAPRPLRILVAEDNPVNQQLVIKILTKRGHTAQVVSTGMEAVEIYSKEPCDLVLMDVQMPGMDGYQTAAAIRQIEKTTGVHVPIVALTAQAMKGDRERCLAAGMDDYMSKPIRAAEFLAKIERMSVVRWEDELEEAFRQMGDDPQIFKEAAEIFLKYVPGHVSELEAAFRTGDAGAIESAAHKIKGTLSYFTQKRPYELAVELERCAREKHLDRAERLVVELKSAARQMKQAIESYVRKVAVG
ncbi:response regulator [bacterium]|nr:response regulator [bacterium]